MPRLTITLSEERHRQLKMRAAHCGKSIGQLIEEELAASEATARAAAMAALEMAWTHSDRVRPNATDDEVMAEVLAIMREDDERTADVPG